MRLSDGTVLGLCYGFSMVAAQLYVVFAASEVRLENESAAMPRMLGWSLVIAAPVAAGIWTFDWLLKGLDGRPDRGLHMSIAGLLAIAWALTAMSILAGSSAKRLKQASGVDVLGRARIRTALIGGALGLAIGGLYIFLPRLIRGTA